MDRNRRSRSPEYAIQSRGRDLSNLEEAFAEANDGDIVCLAETEDVKTMYLEDTAEEQAQPA